MKHIMDRAWEFGDLQTFYTNGKINACGKDEYDQGNAPYEVIDCTK